MDISAFFFASELISNDESFCFSFFFLFVFLRSLDTVPSEPMFKSWSKISPPSPDSKILMSLSFVVFQQPRCKLLMQKCMIFKPIWTLPAFP